MAGTTVQERMDKEKIEVTCVDCGETYRKNKYVAAKAQEQVCKACNTKRMKKRKFDIRSQKV